MASTSLSSNDTSLRDAIESSKAPFVLPGRAESWPMLKWTLNEWCQKIGPSRILPIRSNTKTYSEIPQWESTCLRLDITIEQFLKSASSSNQEWFYFDYKHFREWFETQPDIMEGIDWGIVGFPDRKGLDSTIWIGSEGAHTPCHVDTYGFNLVAQIYGEKQWLLFPPGSDQNLKATRVPYEESSIYSEINFYSPPKDLKISNCYEVTLKPGDVLFVPNGWWHYVETVSPVAISVNTWVPLPTDTFRQLQESIVKMWVASVIKLSGHNTEILNANEVDLPEDKNILNYVKWAAEASAKTEEEVEPPNKRMRSASPKPADSVQNLEVLTEDNFIKLMNSKRSKFPAEQQKSNVKVNPDLNFCKNVINAVGDSNVLSLIAQNLLDYMKRKS